MALFIFLSGYGLTVKYGTRELRCGPYIKSHLVKLWRLLVPVYIIYCTG